MTAHDSIAVCCERDRRVWDSCAQTYEKRIVGGHPDVTAYEGFEHCLVEHLVLHLVRDCARTLHLYDFGCGSGRFHRALAPWLSSCMAGDDDESVAGTGNEGGIAHIGGVDFSVDMIDLARERLKEEGLAHLHPCHLSFDSGSAFDVPPYDGPCTPLALSVCNSVGVMQGPEGARKLLGCMRRYVERQRGIALVSCYRREAVRDYALSNYESTMDVSGQPCWLEPAPAESSDQVLVPHRYKRARDTDPGIVVDVHNAAGRCMVRGLHLRRNEKKVQQVVESGSIETWGEYRSHWYGEAQVREWMRELWCGAQLWHFTGSALDVLGGEPAQIAIADFSGAFASLARRWGLNPLS